MCNYPQISLLHNGGVSCFVDCGSPCDPGPGQCRGPLALCWPCASGRSPPISLRGHCFSCPVTGAQSAGLCPSFGTTLGPSAAPVPIYSSISICACLRCTSIPLCLLPSSNKFILMGWRHVGVLTDTVPTSWSADSSFHLLVLVPQRVSHEMMDISVSVHF